MKRILAALALAVPLLAGAQDAAPTLQQDPRAPRFGDVERGFFIGFEAGYLGMLDTPVADPAKFPTAGTSGGSAGGLVVGLTMGVDLGSRVSVALFGQGGNEKANANYGAFSLLSTGLDLRVSVIGEKDRNGWDRFFVYLHGRGGYAKSFPTGLFGDTDTVVQGGLGLEYYTQLRHFSVGFAGDYVYATKAKASGVAVYPTIRYTF
ncbi:adventurous gliding motility protein CglE [Anaeromyxobacter oryzae]|uniref:Outer membrane protein beta-barrel domain-containing protein n=1 Tax=Anaeromyxobacter oryzae TaxID=2918170 RepID=A0ABM7WZM0_9BACT|nr:adventurous gliding motility protein CglE [Anaeromyxobacter oryzae]BDG04935.1 hypothetical protein AMOR_39310 [Anaeromyxobacter oryzae]